MKIYEVADQLGFESAFYFSKVFKRWKVFRRGSICRHI